MNFLTNWYKWIHHNPIPFLTLIGVLGTSIGTFALAVATLKQGKNNQADNKRHDKLLRDTFMIENRRKVYRDVLIFITAWRQHFQELDGYVNGTMQNAGSLSASALKEIGKMIDESPLSSNFDQLAMTVSLDLEDDHQIEELLQQWAGIRGEILGYLTILRNSIELARSAGWLTPAVPGAINPFNPQNGQSFGSSGSYPSDIYVANILSSVRTLIERLNAFETEFNVLMIRRLALAQEDPHLDKRSGRWRLRRHA